MRTKKPACALQNLEEGRRVPVNQGEKYSSSHPISSQPFLPPRVWSRGAAGY